MEPTTHKDEVVNAFSLLMHWFDVTKMASIRQGAHEDVYATFAKLHGYIEDAKAMALSMAETLDTPVEEPVVPETPVAPETSVAPVETVEVMPQATPETTSETVPQTAPESTSETVPQQSTSEAPVAPTSEPTANGSEPTQQPTTESEPAATA